MLVKSRSWLKAALVLIFFATPIVADPIGTAHLAFGAGMASLFSQVRLRVDLASPFGAPIATLVPEFTVHTGDVGRTFSLSSGPQFEAASSSLTDGSPESIVVWHGPQGGGLAGFPFPVQQLFFGNSGRVDFAGFHITSLDFRLDEFNLTSPGENPNGDGLWTEYTVRGTLTVNGAPVPEPTTIVLLATSLTAIILKTRRKGY